MIFIIIISMAFFEAIRLALTPTELALVLLDYVTFPVLIIRSLKDPVFAHKNFTGWASYRRKSLVGIILLFVTA